MTWLALLMACAAQTAAPDFEAFFEEFAQKRDGLVVLEAEFEQKTILPDDILTTPGSLLYAEPRRIVFRTEDPERVTLIDGRTGYEYEPPIKQLTVFELEDNPQIDVFFLAFEDDAARLREDYQVRLFTIDADPRGTRGITVEPKPDGGATAYFKRVDLYLRDEDMLPYRMHIEHNEESDVIIDISKYRVNEAPEPRRTQIHVASGTTIIENDAVAEVTETERYMPEPVFFGNASEDAPEDPPGEEEPAVSATALDAPAAQAAR